MAEQRFCKPFSYRLDHKYPDTFREELIQMIRVGTFVVVQQRILYRVLEDAGPRRTTPFRLDQLDVPRASTDPHAIKTILDQAFSLAIRRSNDFATAFLPQPFVDLVHADSEGAQETADCTVGEVWHQLRETVKMFHDSACSKRNHRTVFLITCIFQTGEIP